ncbi:MAG: peptidoglycan recognition family protein [Phycisphaerales bacterium]|jgi:hypothetical protein
MASASAKSKSRSRKAGSKGVTRRSKVVVGALLAAMTIVGGGLVMVDPHASPAAQGLTIPTLVATAGPDTVEVIFNTPTPITQGRWKAIVIHDSGSMFATPATMEEDARRIGLRGLGYQFVIGNGSGLDDGELHVGARWLNQTAGAHTTGKNGDWYNTNALGICLVGDGERRPFTPTQIRRLTQLVDALCRELKIPADHVYLQSQLAASPSPGKYFPEAAFRAEIAGIR